MTDVVDKQELHSMTKSQERKKKQINNNKKTLQWMDLVLNIGHIHKH